MGDIHCLKKMFATFYRISAIDKFATNSGSGCNALCRGKQRLTHMQTFNSEILLNVGMFMSTVGSK
jgi:hypothetical protein